jgi:hypothetical protein
MQINRALSAVGHNKPDSAFSFLNEKWRFYLKNKLASANICFEEEYLIIILKFARYENAA